MVRRFTPPPSGRTNCEVVAVEKYIPHTPDELDTLGKTVARQAQKSTTDTPRVENLRRDIRAIQDEVREALRTTDDGHRAICMVVAQHVCRHYRALVHKSDGNTLYHACIRLGVRHVRTAAFELLEEPRDPGVRDVIKVLLSRARALSELSPEDFR